ncbi:MAG TPA: hypothetical protein H9900_01330 [Candidatus Monoglobus merdigallinarum]|uniref:Uncharacterized protein n=1 Tax=Candidatus Monoglobus merdigallinarum TaxID=2838698 RepID=A0A9D1PQ89_9FIRM|nr:hypothetical protein [Candidatus Monoglobus merdigallinarum]
MPGVFRMSAALLILAVFTSFTLLSCGADSFLGEDSSNHGLEVSMSVVGLPSDADGIYFKSAASFDKGLEAFGVLPEPLKDGYCAYAAEAVSAGAVEPVHVIRIIPLMLC